MLETGVEPVHQSNERRIFRSTAEPVTIAVFGCSDYPSDRNDWLIRTVRQRIIGAAVANRGVCIRRTSGAALDQAIGRWVRTLTPSFAKSELLPSVEDMLNGADILVAFPKPGKRIPDSETWACIELAHELGIEVVIPSWKDPDSD